ncbi:MAG: hypothetical protein ABWZ91_02520 [Nocardioides sp.]
MTLFTTARGRRLLFVMAVVVVLAVPLIASLATRARVDSSGTDVTATVVETSRKGDSYLVAFRFPKNVDPEQDTYSAQVDRSSYERAAQTKKITVRVLEGRPEAHRAEGEIRDNTPYLVMPAGIILVLLIGLWWARTGRRRPTVRMRASAPLEPADAADGGALGREPGEDVYEAVGTVLSADDAEVVLDVGERHVVVLLSGYDNPVPEGSPARARGPVIG